jgi:hypothetical protein
LTLLSKEEIVNLSQDDENNLSDLFDDKIDKNFNEIEDLLKDIDESEKNLIDDFTEVIEFNDNFGLNNISFDYDDETLINNNKSEEENFTSIFENNDANDTELESVDFSKEIFPTVHEKKQVVEDKIMPLKGDIMLEDEFSELDSLSEKDLLEALNYSEKDLSNIAEKIAASQDIVKNSTIVEIVESANVNELASLLSKLLNNKTLEITIKIKD